MITLVSIVCALVVGYAAERGSICAVRGVEDVLSGRSWRLFLSFGRCALWVLAVTLPFVALGRAAHLSPDYPATLAALGGAFLFGAGAAVNGGCSFGTIIRLAAGEISFAFTLAGLALGFAAQNALTGRAGVAVAAGPSPLAQGGALVPALLAITIVWAGVEARSVARGAPPALRRRWPPECAAMAMGLAGGLLYALNGPWTYTIALDREMALAAVGGGLGPRLLLIFLGVLAGAFIAVLRERGLVWRWSARDAALRLGAGTLMGLGAALVPGGNDALVMHALPALSHHALPAYLALVAGVAATLALRARLSPAAGRAAGRAR